MIYDCGITKPWRATCRPWRALGRRVFWAHRIDHLVRLELAVLMATPGITVAQLKVMFGWNARSYDQARLIARMTTVDPDLVAANLASVTMEDGEEMLRLMLAQNPDRAHAVPWWTTLALMERRRRGQSAVELAREFGVPVVRMRRWWGEDRFFDPLAGSQH